MGDDYQTFSQWEATGKVGRRVRGTAAEVLQVQLWEQRHPTGYLHVEYETTDVNSSDYVQVTAITATTDADQGLHGTLSLSKALGDSDAAPVVHVFRHDERTSEDVSVTLPSWTPTAPFDVTTVPASTDYMVFWMRNGTTGEMKPTERPFELFPGGRRAPVAQVQFTVTPHAHLDLRVQLRLRSLVGTVDTIDLYDASRDGRASLLRSTVAWDGNIAAGSTTAGDTFTVDLATSLQDAVYDAFQLRFLVINDYEDDFAAGAIVSSERGSELETVGVLQTVSGFSPKVAFVEAAGDVVLTLRKDFDEEYTTLENPAVVTVDPSDATRYTYVVPVRPPVGTVVDVRVSNVLYADNVTAHAHTIVDTTPPAVSLLPATDDNGATLARPYHVLIGAEFEDPGVVSPVVDYEAGLVPVVEDTTKDVWEELGYASADAVPSFFSTDTANTFRFTYRVEDSSGNRAEVHRYVRVDAFTPTISPAESFVSDNGVTLAGVGESAGSLLRLTYEKDGGTAAIVTDVTVGSGGAWSHAVPSATFTSPGRYEFFVVALDADGNESPPRSSAAVVHNVGFETSLSRLRLLPDDTDDMVAYAPEGSTFQWLTSEEDQLVDGAVNRTPASIAVPGRYKLRMTSGDVTVTSPDILLVSAPTLPASAVAPEEITVTVHSAISTYVTGFSWSEFTSTPTGDALNQTFGLTAEGSYKITVTFAYAGATLDVPSSTLVVSETAADPTLQLARYVGKNTAIQVSGTAATASVQLVYRQTSGGVDTDDTIADVTIAVAADGSWSKNIAGLDTGSYEFTVTQTHVVKGVSIPSPHVSTSLDVVGFKDTFVRLRNLDSDTVSNTTELVQHLPNATLQWFRATDQQVVVDNNITQVGRYKLRATYADFTLESADVVVVSAPQLPARAVQRSQVTVNIDADIVNYATDFTWGDTPSPSGTALGGPFVVLADASPLTITVIFAHEGNELTLSSNTMDVVTTPAMTALYVRDDLVYYEHTTPNVLSANITPLDPYTRVSAYQWVHAADGNTFGEGTVLTNSTDATHTISEDDIGKSLKLRYTLADATGTVTAVAETEPQLVTRGTLPETVSVPDIIHVKDTPFTTNVDDYVASSLGPLPHGVWIQIDSSIDDVVITDESFQHREITFELTNGDTNLFGSFHIHVAAPLESFDVTDFTAHKTTNNVQDLLPPTLPISSPFFDANATFLTVTKVVTPAATLVSTSDINSLQLLVDDDTSTTVDDTSTSVTVDYQLTDRINRTIDIEEVTVTVIDADVVRSGASIDVAKEAVRTAVTRARGRMERRNQNVQARRKETKRVLREIMGQLGRTSLVVDEENTLRPIFGDNKTRLRTGEPNVTIDLVSDASLPLVANSYFPLATGSKARRRLGTDGPVVEMDRVSDTQTRFVVEGTAVAQTVADDALFSYTYDAATHVWRAGGATYLGELAAPEIDTPDQTIVRTSDSVTFTGTGSKAGNTITLSYASNTVIAIVQVDGDKTWSATVSSWPSEGAYTISATETEELELGGSMVSPASESITMHVLDFKFTADSVHPILVTGTDAQTFTLASMYGPSNVVSFQWTKDGTPYSNSSALTVSGITRTNTKAGVYRLTVTDVNDNDNELFQEFLLGVYGLPLEQELEADGTIDFVAEPSDKVTDVTWNPATVNGEWSTSSGFTPTASGNYVASITYKFNDTSTTSTTVDTNSLAVTLTSVGDPYVTPLHGPRLKLPDRSACYRLFQVGDTVVNAQVGQLGKGHDALIRTYFAGRLRGGDVPIVGGYFYTGFWVQHEGATLFLDVSSFGRLHMRWEGGAPSGAESPLRFEGSQRSMDGGSICSGDRRTTYVFRFGAHALCVHMYDNPQIHCGVGLASSAAATDRASGLLITGGARLRSCRVRHVRSASSASKARLRRARRRVQRGLESAAPSSLVATGERWYQV